MEPYLSEDRQQYSEMEVQKINIDLRKAFRQLEYFNRILYK
jgi:hypothetical protein